jgi:gliding motility-associated protein GldE
MGILLLVVLLISSALLSGSEVAFFSLSPGHMQKIKENQSKVNSLILKLFNEPEKLLATILISNNFVNVGIVILGAFITNPILEFSIPWVTFVVQGVFITFLILLFGEILPKVYASMFPLQFSYIMAYPINILSKIFQPLSFFLIKSTSIFNNRLRNRKSNLSIDDLSEAIDIAGDDLDEDKKILKGIVSFGNTDVKEIMRSRVDVISVDISFDFNKLKSIIIESGYSRLPVFEEGFDNIKGVLFIKDVLPHIDEPNDFTWHELIRKPFFVPENKKIDDLLKDFQDRKMHIAIVVDEYGGASGIVTLEDVIEEIVGDIKDELDDVAEDYIKISNDCYVFEGRTLINDFYRILELEEDVLDNYKGDADSLAGLILEYKGEMPEKNEEIEIENFLFKIKSVDERRIKQLQIKILKSKDE